MLPIFWPAILIYYMVTRKYFCPKCGSDFLGIKDKSGVYKAQSTGSSPLLWIIVVLIGIAIIGILASVVLASLNSARDKGADAALKSNLNNLRAQAELYYESNSNSYSGFCDSSGTKTIARFTPEQGYVCNDTLASYAASASLTGGSHYCIDSTGAATTTNTVLGIKESCSGDGTENVSWEKYDSSLDKFSINFPVKPAVDNPVGDSSDGYKYRTYTASDGASTYFVAVYHYEEIIDVSDPQTLLKNMVSNISDDSLLITSSYHSYAAYPEIEFTVKSDEEMLKGKVILVEQTPFLVMYNYLPSNYSDEDYKTFVGSLKFN